MIMFGGRKIYFGLRKLIRLELTQWKLYLTCNMGMTHVFLERPATLSHYKSVIVLLDWNGCS
jgi:Mor family transcriptional regulator